MLACSNATFPSFELIHFVHEDDERLLTSPEGVWFQALYALPWQEYRERAAQYYDALYTFNHQESNRKASLKKKGSTSESKEEAKIRLLFDRVTMQKSESKKPPVLFEGSPIETLFKTVDPATLSPGEVPLRLGGKTPKCFFALFKSFLGATLMGFPPEPEQVYRLLSSNPSFVRVCGFVQRGESETYYFKHIPSIRKLEQFDQIMRDFGIWDQIKWKEVRLNIDSKTIQLESELVGDTTHYHAYSGFETVRYSDEEEKEKKKSQSKTTKSCHCDSWETCPHPWVLADEGAGTIVKSNKKMIWGHKASILGLPKQGIPLDAVAVSDASTHDGETFLPHVQKLFSELPEVKPWIERALYDSACDTKELKKQFQEELQIELKVSMNPRRKKDVLENLPRGIQKITPYGNPICWEGYEMDYQGIRYQNEKFVFRAPIHENGKPVCLHCPQKKQCCPNSLSGRMLNIAWETLPHIDPNDPPMAKRFKAIMTRRPSVERMIKKLKCDLSDDRLSKRGNPAFQAYLDKTMIAFHILLRQ